MIPRADIIAWRAYAPWLLDEQVEQDLLICRTLVDIYSDPVLRRSLAFRGGTALHKLFLNPPSRYSEDIDLVQVQAGAFGPILDLLRSVIDPVLGKPTHDRKDRSVILRYSFDSEIPPTVRMRLKVEVNTREHFAVQDWQTKPFAVTSNWFTGRADIRTYSLGELLGTKLRALYQRRKGRDLYDLWLGLTRGGANPQMVISAFQAYLAHDGLRVTQRELRKNLLSKMAERGFLGDIAGLLAQQYQFDAVAAYDVIERELIGRLTP
jgi:predicted nucleotidyltransferase component of viral defense system